MQLKPISEKTRIRIDDTDSKAHGRLPAGLDTKQAVAGGACCKPH